MWHENGVALKTRGEKRERTYEEVPSISWLGCLGISLLKDGCIHRTLPSEMVGEQ